jgi:hypothetical protein
MMQKYCKSYWSPEYLLNGVIIRKIYFHSLYAVIIPHLRNACFTSLFNNTEFSNSTPYLEKFMKEKETDKADSEFFLLIQLCS